MNTTIFRLGMALVFGLFAVAYAFAGLFWAKDFNDAVFCLVMELICMGIAIYHAHKHMG